MIISIEDLRNSIHQRFDNYKDSSYFGVAETVYNYKTDGLILKVTHFLDNDNNKAFQLTFMDVSCSRITQDSYTHEFQEEIFEGFSFFWQIKNSRFKKDFNSWSIYDKIHGPQQFNNLKSYRIVGQNNFIDILTTEEPIIELIDEQ